MKKKYWTLLLLLFQLNAFSQEKDSVIHYRILIKFESVCCGVPNDTPLQKLIHSFKKKNNLSKITAYRIGPLGREGEYSLGFNLTELKATQRKKITLKIKELAPSLNDKGKVTIVENETIVRSSLPSNGTIKKITF